MTEQENVEIILTERCGGTKITNAEDLREYCEYYMCEDIIYDYVDDEYGPCYMGNMTYEASDIVRNCGDASDFYDDYLDDQFSGFDWKDLEQYETGDIYKIAGIEFYVEKKVHEKTEEEKAEEERQAIEEERTRFVFNLRSFITNIPTAYPHCADLGLIIPIVCEELTKAIEEKKKIVAMTPAEACDELSKLLNKEGA